MVIKDITSKFEIKCILLYKQDKLCCLHKRFFILLEIVGHNYSHYLFHPSTYLSIFCLENNLKNIWGSIFNLHIFVEDNESIVLKKHNCLASFLACLFRRVKLLWSLSSSCKNFAKKLLEVSTPNLEYLLIMIGCSCISLKAIVLELWLFLTYFFKQNDGPRQMSIIIACTTMWYPCFRTFCPELWREFNLTFYTVERTLKDTKLSS